MEEVNKFFFYQTLPLDGLVNGVSIPKKSHDEYQNEKREEYHALPFFQISKGLVSYAGPLLCPQLEFSVPNEIFRTVNTFRFHEVHSAFHYEILVHCQSSCFTNNFDKRIYVLRGSCLTGKYSSNYFFHVVWKNVVCLMEVEEEGFIDN